MQNLAGSFQCNLIRHRKIISYQTVFLLITEMLNS